MGYGVYMMMPQNRVDVKNTGRSNIRLAVHQTSAAEPTCFHLTERFCICVSVTWDSQENDRKFWSFPHEHCFDVRFLHQIPADRSHQIDYKSCSVYCMRATWLQLSRSVADYRCTWQRQTINGASGSQVNFYLSSCSRQDLLSPADVYANFIHPGV